MGDHVKTQGEGPEKNQPCLPLDLGFLALILGENRCLWFKPSGLWYFVLTAEVD